MNTRTIIACLAGISALALAGCGPKDEPAKPATTSQNAADRAADAADRAGDRAGDAIDRTGDAFDRSAESATSAAKRAGDTLSDAWDDIADATYEDRSRFRASVDNLERSVDAKMEELQARGANASGSARQTWDRGMERLRAARADLRREITDLENATADNWRQAKAEVADAWQRVRDSYRELEAQNPNS